MPFIHDDFLLSNATARSSPGSNMAVRSIRVASMRSSIRARKCVPAVLMAISCTI